MIDIQEAEKIDATDRSFIDYDEIEPLIQGLDFISKAKSDITKLTEFEATYKTKGTFSISTYSSSGSIKVAVTSGYIRPVTAFISLEQLGKLRTTIVEAKQKLDSSTKKLDKV